ncbi:MAG TPA: hypothetical protein PLD10_24415 [Rhodopila sp.]|nr:hypothetical protein [Rhodopila sp.]
MFSPGVNLVRYSGDFTQPTWQKNNAAAFDLGGLSLPTPTGVVQRLVSLGTEQPPNYQLVEENFIPEYQANTPYAASVWFKNESWATHLQLGLFDSNLGAMQVVFDPTTMTVISTSAFASGSGVPWSSPTSQIVSLANGWSQVILTGTSNAQNNLTMNFVLSAATLADAAPTGKSFLLAGAALYQNQLSAPVFALTTTNPLASVPTYTWQWPDHVTATRYPQNGTSIQFGNSYVFTASPKGPPQRMFTLEFAALRWYLDDNDMLDIYTDVAHNAGALNAFYLTVQTWKSFSYNHPQFGPLNVRFFKALQLPPPVAGGNGVIEKIQIDLVEQP